MNNQVEYKGLISWNIFVRAHVVDFKSNLLRLCLFPIIFTPFIWMMNSPASNKIIATVLAVLFIPLFFAVQRFLWYRSFKRFPYLQEPMKGVVSSEGLQIENALGNSQMNWQMFSKSKEKDDCVLLYTSPHSFQILAKEFFTGEDAWIKAKNIISLGMQRRA